VSPDHRVRDPGWSVGDAIASVARRIRMLALAEAAAWGAALAALSPAVAVMTAVAVAVWRWRAARRAEIIHALERTQPAARNLFVTADEVERGVLAVTPTARERVLADAAASVATIDLQTMYPVAPVMRAAMVTCVAWGLAGTAGLWRGPLHQVGSVVLSPPASQNDGDSQPRLRVNVRIQPPAYTGLEATTSVDPGQLRTIEGAVAAVLVESPAGRVTLEHDGATRSLERVADGRFSGRIQLTKTGYLLVAADEDARRMIPVLVSPDALPSVRVTTPGRDLVYGGGNPRIAFEARATDDFGLRSLALRYTIVSGSGEQFDFKDGEISLTVTPASVRDWKGTASRSLSDLKLKDGDMLVYRAVAADTRPGDGNGSSDAFVIEISKLGVAAGDAFTLPEEEARYAVSQQMLIVKTERLHQRRGAMRPVELAEAALNLAVEQRMIRAEFVFMLGGEIQDEEVEAEQSTELQAGRLQNRGQRDVRAATIAMSQAEKHLTGADTARALIAERAAVTALQRAFSRERYILRALATQSQLDPTRRLTGNLSEARDWRRSPMAVPANRRTALLQDLLRGIAELSGGQTGVRPESDRGPGSDPGPSPAAGPAGAADAPLRQRALVLAEEAIRIDPAAALLRQTATELQRVADAVADPAARSGALAAATTAAASEARRAHAEPPLGLPNVAPALTGAFADSLDVARRASGRPR
jgi:hypothetical protein